MQTIIAFWILAFRVQRPGDLVSRPIIIGFYWGRDMPYRASTYAYKGREDGYAFCIPSTTPRHNKDLRMLFMKPAAKLVMCGESEVATYACEQVLKPGKARRKQPFRMLSSSLPPVSWK